ncbi:dynamitin family protein [Halorubrum vacuolatum]|uniref:Uncharacterized protein n=1 Tax=Halorubrum vacuolatum TaxID=63740 RepID=A0A238XGE7_HALVU|nr:hypothetical protein [Halorubrum vacuolatum]SNR57404.1 hypothetical protein SAMN06264855_11712 [Halorubrum vacuolatum]
MSVITDYKLRDPDIQFLLAVKEISENPNEYEFTDQGKTPANAAALRRETGLSKTQIDYRVKRGERGFAEDGMKLLRTHAPMINDEGGYDPRSVELTDKGERVVAEIRDVLSGSSGGGDGGGLGEDAEAIREEIEALKNEVSELRSELEKKSEALDQIEASETGALSSEYVDRLEAVLGAVPFQQIALKHVLGVDIDHLEAADKDDREIERLRKEVLATLNDQGGDAPNDPDDHASDGDSITQTIDLDP